MTAEVQELVSRARNGDRQAWDALVSRFAPMIWSICRKYGLSEADAQDAGQSVWLHLVDHLDRVRDPAALPGWLATTTRRECLRIRRGARAANEAGLPPDAEDEQAATADAELLVAERHAALHEAFTSLPAFGQRLIALLIEDPPLPYAEISARLGIPIGSIGPNRRRCLARLRGHPALATLIADEASAADADLRHAGRVLGPVRQGG